MDPRCGQLLLVIPGDVLPGLAECTQQFLRNRFVRLPDLRCAHTHADRIDLRTVIVAGEPQHCVITVAFHRAQDLLCARHDRVDPACGAAGSAPDRGLSPVILKDVHRSPCPVK